MTYRAKVYGRASARSRFGVDIYEISSPADVTDIDGVLIIKIPASPAKPFVPDPARPSVIRPSIKATRGSQVCYARGEWSKVIVTDYVEDDES